MLIDVLHNLLNRIRKQKEITGEWKNGLLVKLPKKELRPFNERVRGITFPVISKGLSVYHQYKVWIS